MEGGVRLGGIQPGETRASLRKRVAQADWMTHIIKHLRVFALHAITIVFPSADAAQERSIGNETVATRFNSR